MALTEKDHEILWKLIDEEFDPEEENLIKQKLETDLPFKEEWQNKLLIHQIMQGIEPKSPSMRFVQNVMDHLPKLHGRLVITPLIPKEYIRNFILASSFFVVSLIAISWGNSSLTPPNTPLNQISAELSNTILGVPYHTWTIIASITFGILSLMALDKVLKKV